MPEKYKKLIFRTALLLCFIGVMSGLLLILYTVIHPIYQEEWIGFFILLYLIPSPLIIVGVILTLVGLLLKQRSKIIRIIIIISLLFLIWGADQFYFQWLLFPFNKLAIATKNELICSILPTFDHNFKDNCYIEVAKRNKDLDVCDKIYYSWNKESCYKDVAVAARDLSFCDKKVEDWQFRGDCYADIAIVAEDESICEMVPRNISYMDISFPKVTIMGGKWEIKDYCYARFAIAKKDPFFCEKIMDSKNRSRCEESLK
jgi:hypothetical protein